MRLVIAYATMKRTYVAGDAERTEGKVSAIASAVARKPPPTRKPGKRSRKTRRRLAHARARSIS